MFRLFPAAALALAFVALPAIAQSGDPAHPADPGVRVRPLTHRSTLAGRPAPDTPEVADWRATNERVRAVGGWKAYLKQVQAPDPAPTPTPEVAR
jgi:hypothetical protein